MYEDLQIFIYIALGLINNKKKKKVKLHWTSGVAKGGRGEVYSFSLNKINMLSILEVF